MSDVSRLQTGSDDAIKETRVNVLTVIRYSNGTECKVGGKSVWPEEEARFGIVGPFREWLACGGVNLDEKIADDLMAPRLRTMGLVLKLTLRYENRHDVVGHRGVVCFLIVESIAQWSLLGTATTQNFGVTVFVSVTGNYKITSARKLLSSFVELYVFAQIPAYLTQFIALYGLGFTSEIYRRARRKKFSVDGHFQHAVSRMLLAAIGYRGIVGGVWQGRMSDHPEIKGLTDKDLHWHLTDMLAKPIEEGTIEHKHLYKMSQVVFQKLAGPTGTITFTDFVCSCTEDDILNFKSIARLFGGKEKVRRLQSILDDAHMQMQDLVANARNSRQTVRSSEMCLQDMMARVASVRGSTHTAASMRNVASGGRGSSSRTTTSDDKFHRPLDSVGTTTPRTSEKESTIEHQRCSQERLPVPYLRGSASGYDTCESGDLHRRLSALERAGIERRLQLLEAGLIRIASDRRDDGGVCFARRLEALESSAKAQPPQVHELNCKVDRVAESMEQQAAELAALRFKTVVQLEQQVKGVMAKLQDSLAMLVRHCASLEGRQTEQQLPSAELPQSSDACPLSGQQTSLTGVAFSGGRPPSYCSTPPRAVAPKAEGPLLPSPRGIGKPSDKRLVPLDLPGGCISSTLAPDRRHPTLARALTPRKEASWDKQHDKLPFMAQHPILGTTLRPERELERVPGGQSLPGRASLPLEDRSNSAMHLSRGQRSEALPAAASDSRAVSAAAKNI